LTGNDLTPRGDVDSKGFSARGWDAEAALNALRAAHSVLKCMESFVEGVVLCEKEKGAVMTTCFGRWSDGLEKVRLHKVQTGVAESKKGQNNPPEES
jgi:hypothetical protein